MRSIAQGAEGLNRWGIILAVRLFGISTQVCHTVVRLAAKTRDLGETALSEGSAGRALISCIIPWHSPYDCGKSTVKTPVRVCRNVPGGLDPFC